jgi:protein transport protein HofC
VSTGPAKPFAGDEIDRESEVAQSQPVGAVERDWKLDPAQLSFSPRQGRWSVRHLMYLVAIVAVLLWLRILVIVILSSVVFLFATVMSIGVIVARRRSARQDALLSVLAIAAEKEMPLAPAVLAFADQYSGGSHRRIMELAAQLNGGAMLPEALERVPRVVSRDGVLLAWVGQAAGTLPKALRVAAASRVSYLSIWTAIAARVTYILALLLAMQTITAFMMYFIMPKFEAIFKDFSLPLPSLTVWLIDASHFIIKYGAPLLLVPLAELVLLFVVPLSFLSWGNFTVPLLDHLLGRRHTALILRALSLVVDGQKPVSLGLATLASHYPAWRIRWRLVSVESDVRQGVDWIQALWRHGLIRATDAEVLASAAAVGNLGWVLSELAETAERRLAMRSQAVIQTLFPLVVVMLGMMVFFLCVAYFIPLVLLIGRLTDS